VKRRAVIFSPEAANDLERLYDYIAGSAGVARADAWLLRIEIHCQSFDMAAERGTVRNDIQPGLRVSSFGRRMTLAFTVTPTQVTFLRLFYAGTDWEAAFPAD
jgi:toxin ParE1/3/4